VSQGSGWEELKEEQKGTTIEDEDVSDLPKVVDMKGRDGCRLIRALRKVSDELRGSRSEKMRPEKQVYRAFITLEGLVGVHHLSHRVGKEEEFQTTLQHPHQFRKTLIRAYRLKNLRWSLLRKQRDGSWVRMPELKQILEDDAEYILRIEEQKRKRPNTPGSSKSRHFERANQRRRRDFTWSPEPHLKLAPDLIRFSQEQ
jgi:hypothetical protein